MEFKSSPKELMVKWLEALRSGEYEQGKFCLRSETNKFCCLGVLCDVVGKETGTVWEFSPSQNSHRFTSSAATLPNEIGEYIGLAKYDPLGDCDSDALVLMKMNDCGEHTFPEIADHIEKQYLPRLS